MDIKAPVLGKTPDAVVIVATVRALKMNGGVSKKELDAENVAAVEQGYANLRKHVQNMQRYGLPVLVALNRFVQDTDAELQKVQELCEQDGTKAFVCDVWAKGGNGALELADAVVEACDKKTEFKPLYGADDEVEVKIEKIVKEIYGGAGVEFGPKAKKQLAQFRKLGWDKLPVCMAKTQFSLSDDASLLGAPTGFTIHVREFVPKLGAGFLVALTGNVLTMPGLPKVPAAMGIDLTDEGVIEGLY